MTAEGDRFARGLRAAIDASGLSVRELARRCTRAGAQVSAPTLRSWAAGTSRPVRRASFEIVDVLEQVLGTGAGALSDPLRVPDAGRHAVSSPLARLGAEVASLRERHGLPPAELFTHELISTTLDLDVHSSPLLRHRVMGEAAAGVDGLIALLDVGERKIGPIEVRGGELLSADRVDERYLGVAISLPRPLEAGEVALVDLTAPTQVGLRTPGRLSTLSPWPAALVVAALHAEKHEYAGRAVRTDHDPGEPRTASQDVDLLPGATGMQCVARDVRAAEVAVEWRPGAAPI